MERVRARAVVWQTNAGVCSLLCSASRASIAEPDSAIGATDHTNSMQFDKLTFLGGSNRELSSECAY